MMISPDVFKLFCQHPWPGNIRQMVSVIQIAAAMADNYTITIDDLPDDFMQDIQHHHPHPNNNVTLLPSAIPTQELDEHWLETYEQCGRNVSATAKELSISRNTLYKRLRERGLR
jgi:transcriptional regulator of acetoin/glycerol metabolism